MNSATIQSKVLSHPSIEDCLIVDRSLADGRSVIVAYLVSSTPLNHERLSLPPEVRLVPVAAIPLTPTGQPDVDALARLPITDATTIGLWETTLRARLGPDLAVIVDEATPTLTPLHLDHILPNRALPPTPPAGSSQTTSPALGTASDRSAALVQGAPLPPTGLTTLASMLRRAAARPDAGIRYLAADGSETVQSYPDLLRAAERVAAGLHRRGIGPQTLVMLQLGTSRDVLTAFWGCQLAGAIPIPVGLASPHGRATAATETMLKSWEVMGRPLVLTSAAAHDRLRSALDQHHAAPRLVLLDDLSAETDPLSPAQPDPEAVAVVMMTSGSTGIPKGVPLTHRNLLSQAQGQALSNGLTDADTILNWAPLDHVGGLANSHLTPMYCGAAQLQCDAGWILEDPIRWLDLLARDRCAGTFAPNFAYALVNERLASTADRTWDFRAMKAFWNAGEAVVTRTARRFLTLLAPYGLSSRAMRPAWGMSETCSGLTYGNRFDLRQTSDDDPFVEVGPPNPGTALRIVRPDGSIAWEEEIGRLEVSGDSVMTGYYQNPAATSAAFTSDGWFKTGDLGFVRDGQLTITGREKDLLIINGVNYYSHELESSVEDVDGVVPSYTAACAVRGRGDDTDRMAVFFHTDRADPPSRRAVLGQVRSAIVQRFGVPPDYLILVEPPQIPKTNLGKIQRLELARAFAAGEFATELQRTDCLEANQRTIPDWFLRPAWRLRALTAPREPAPSTTTVVFLDPHGVGDQIGSALATKGRHWVGIRPGPRFAATGPDRYTLDPSDPAHAIRLTSDLAAKGLTIGAAVHAWGLAPTPARPIETDTSDSALDLAASSLLHWLQALAQASNRAEQVGVVVAAHASQRIDAEDAVLPERAAALGVVKCATRELPWLQCRHVDLEPNARAAEYLLAELASPSPDQEIAYRSGHRLVARLARVDWNQPASATDFRRDGFYLITGGLGGIGSAIAHRLLTEFDARVLLLGRVPLARLAAEAADRAEGWASLRELAADRVRYASVDLTDRSAVQALVRQAATEFGQPLAGVIHTAGEAPDRPIIAETSAGLAETIAPRLLGGRTVASLLDRPDQILITVSSAAGWLGGAQLTAYAAASRVADALAADLAATGPFRVHHIDWGPWRGVGLNRRFAASEMWRSRGLIPLSAHQAWLSLLASLRANLESCLIGIDPTHRHIRRLVADEAPHLQAVRVFLAAERSAVTRPALSDAFGTKCDFDLSLLKALPLTATGAVDRQALSGFTPEHARQRYQAPETPVEHQLAKLWEELLGQHQVGRHDNFLELGGHSLLGTQLVTRVREALGVDIPLRTVFAQPTVEGMALAVVQLRAAGADPAQLDRLLTELEQTTS